MSTGGSPQPDVSPCTAKRDSVFTNFQRKESSLKYWIGRNPFMICQRRGAHSFREPTRSLLLPLPLDGGRESKQWEELLGAFARSLARGLHFFVLCCNVARPPPSAPSSLRPVTCPPRPPRGRKLRRKELCALLSPSLFLLQTHSGE